MGFCFSASAQVKPASTTEPNVKTLKFYPNPAVSYINFEFLKDYDRSYALYIFNFIGKQVDEIKVTARKITISLTEYYRGVYIFQLRDSKGNIVESGKFQVAK